MRINLNPLLLLMVLAAIAWAGATSYNSLELNPTGGETNSLRINNSSGTAQLTITAAGAATFAGAVAMQGAQTVTADMTFSGAGIDLLFNAADENEIGSDAAPAEKLWTNELDVEDAAAFAADVTMTGSGIDLLFTTANQNSIGAAATGAKEVFTRAVTGETGTALTLTGSSGITVASTATASAGVKVGQIFGLSPTPESLAAAAMLHPSKSFVFVTGATAITSIDVTHLPAGSILVLNNSAGGDGTGPAITDGGNIKAAGNFTLGPDDTWVGISDGTNVYELHRSAN